MRILPRCGSGGRFYNARMPATSDPEHELPAEIYSTLRAFRRRALLTRAAGGMGSALIASALLLGAALLLDRFFFLSTGARLAVTRTALGGLLLVAAISLWRLFRPMRSAQLARRIEAAAPNLEEGLLSSVQIAALPKKERARFSTELLHSLFRSTTVKLQRVKAGTVIDFHPARRLLLASFVLWGAFAALAAFDPQALLQLGNRFFHPSAELPRPSTVILAVSPGNATVATGDDVELRGQVVRGAPGSVALLVRPEDGEWAEYPILVPSLSRRFTTVQKRFEYRMRAGDFLSPLYEINVRDAPRPVSFQITFHYPTYTGRALETLIRPTGDMAPLRGTHVDVEITASEPLAKAALEFVAADASASQEKKAGAYRDLRVSGSRAKIEDLDVASPGFYRLLLAAPDGVTNGWRA